MTEDQNTLANQAQTENIVKRILTSEVKYIIGIIIFLAGVVAPYYEIKQDIALIKQNHIAHIEALQNDMVKINEEIEDLKEIEVMLMEKIVSQNEKILAR